MSQDTVSIDVSRCGPSHEMVIMPLVGTKPTVGFSANKPAILAGETYDQPQRLPFTKAQYAATRLHADTGRAEACRHSYCTPA